MLVLGGALKRREKISARLGDILSQLYLCSAILKRYEDEGRQAADLPLMHWAMQDGLYKIQTAFEGLCSNFPNRVVGILMRIFVLPLGSSFSPPSDHLGHQVARLLMEPGASRDRLTVGIYAPFDENDLVGRLDVALQHAIACEPIEAKMRAATKARALEGNSAEDKLASALAQGIISEREGEMLKRLKQLRSACIMVDDFAPDFSQEQSQPHAVAKTRAA